MPAPSVPAYVLFRREDDSVVLFNEQSGEPFVLNETGARAFELMDGRRGVEEIAALLADEYDEEPSAIAADVAELVEAMRGRGLVEYG